MLTTVYRPDRRVTVLGTAMSGHSLIAERRATVHPRSQVMTLSRLQRSIKEGAGQGFGENYWPWIRIRRMTSGAVSNLTVFTNPLYARALHLLSGLEVTAATVALWLGATEVREQFPLWPEGHSHPCSADPTADFAQHRDVPGLLDIAAQAGIRHGTYQGTDIPFVATADFLLNVPASRLGKLVLVPVKPVSEIERPDRKGDRVRERLELQRRYSNAIDARYVEFTDQSCSRLLGSQLKCFRPRYSELQERSSSDEVHLFVEHFMSLHQELPISSCRKAVMQRMGIKDVQLSHSLFRVSTWLGLINLDFSKPILEDALIKLDTRGLKDSLADTLFGPRRLS